MKTRILIFQLLIGISFISFSKDYKAGEIQSKKSFHYGRFETKFFASDVSGVLSTIFLFENDGWKNTDIWQEIDVEVFGKDPQNVWESNVIYEKNAAGPQKHSKGVHSFGTEKVAEWHEYVIEWTPDSIKWFVDGENIRKLTDKTILDIVGAKPMLVMLNCWAHTSVGWVGPFDTESLPAYQYVDYVRVYDFNQTTHSFENDASFEDDFSGSLSKWNVSSHTFDGNLCDFNTNNVGTEDGRLILAVSKNDQTSVIDNAPIDQVLDFNELITGDFPQTYPNPTSDIINLVEATSYWVYSATGVLVLTGEGIEIDLSNFNSGLYTLIYNKGEQRIREQIIKE